MNTSAPIFNINKLGGGALVCSLVMGDCLSGVNIDKAEWLGDYFGKEEMRAGFSFASPKRRGEWFGVRVCAKQLLSSALGVEPQQIVIHKTENGKPFIEKHPSINLSVSHSHGFALCAISLAKGRGVGVDVEWVNPKRDWQKIVCDNFSVRERAEVTSARLFYENWTVKEAFWKYLGGVDVLLKDIEVVDGAIYLRAQLRQDVILCVREESGGEYIWAAVS